MTDTRTIAIEYFAVLREYAGKASEQVSTASATPAELYAELSERYDFPELPSLKVAINDEFGEMGAALQDGDAVVFIPPVAGG